MDWPNERFVKVYTRDTLNTMLLSWEARCVFLDLLRRVDGAGVLDLDDHDPVEALAVLMRIPVEVIEKCLAEWSRDGRVEVREHEGRRYLIIPKFQEAQRSSQSDRARAQASREKRRADARRGKIETNKRGAESRHVTGSHATSHVATDGHAESHAVTCDSESERSRHTTNARVTNRDAPVTGGHATSRAVTPRIEENRREESGCERADAHAHPRTHARTEFPGEVLEPDLRDPKAIAIAEELARHPKFGAIIAAEPTFAEELLGAVGAAGFNLDRKEFRAAIRDAGIDTETGATEAHKRRQLRWKFQDLAKSQRGESLARGGSLSRQGAKRDTKAEMDRVMAIVERTNASMGIPPSPSGGRA